MRTNRIIPARGSSWCCTATGIWLLVSPWVLGFSGDGLATWTTVAFGVLVTALALASISTTENGPVWWTVGLGVLLIIAPWVAGFAQHMPLAAGDNVLTGIVLVTLSLMVTVARIPPARPAAG